MVQVHEDTSSYDDAILSKTSSLLELKFCKLQMEVATPQYVQIVYTNYVKMHNS